jgi:4-amino-4-deoxy-L-arabinose transferase-like glycosyltransferase
LDGHRHDNRRRIFGAGYQMKINIRQWFRTTKAKDILIISLIILISIGIRVGITYNTLGAPNYYVMATDIGETARNLAEGRGYVVVVDPEYSQMVSTTQAEKNMLIDLKDFPPPEDKEFVPYYALPPGPSVLLALTYKVSGEYRYIYFRLLEAVIASFGCLLMFLLGKELFNRKIGLIAAFLYAVYLPIAYVSTWVLQDALVPFFTLLTLVLFVMGVKRKRIKYYIFAALVTGIGCYFQTSTIFLLAAFIVGLFIYNLGKSSFRQNILNVLKVAGISVVVFVLILSPWVARNYSVTGSIMLMRTTFWQGIWEGFGEYDNPVGAVLDDEITYEQVVKEVGYNVPYGTLEYDAVLRDKSINAIKEHPLWWLSVLARRVPHTFFYGSELGISSYPRDSQGNILWNEMGDNKSTQFKNAITSAHFGEAWNIIITNPYACFVYGLVIIFSFLPALLSLFAIWLMRRKWREIILVAMAPLYFSLVNIVFFVNWKTLVPGALFYVLFSAIAFYFFAIKLKIIRDDMSAFKPVPEDNSPPGT